MRNIRCRRKFKILAFLLVLATAIPIGVHSQPSVIYAATPKFNVKTRTLDRPGDTYTLTVKNKIKGSKYTWSTSNKKIAKVNKYGLVTAVAKGTATIRCKITYPNKVRKTLTCKITVKLPANTVAISNAKLSVNNTHRVPMGETYDFNRSLTPKTSTDKTYWIIEDESIAVINTKGVLTPKKHGVTRLTAIAAKDKSSIKKSKVTAAILVSVVDKTGSIVSVTPIDSSQIKVTFTHPVKADSVIKDKNKLTDVFSIIAARDENNKMGSPYGDLTAELSSDRKVLTITASIGFNGRYNFTTKTGIITDTGMLIDEYTGTVKFDDNGKPVYKSSSIDESGLVAHITFSEALNITNLGITRLSRTDNITLSKVTEGVLTNTSNYKLSKDKKTIILDMNGISMNDQNKTIEIRLSGIKDLTGNATDPTPAVVFVQTDTSIKPQAQLVSVRRTAYNKITAYFSRGLKTAGTLSIGSEKMNGVIDEEDSKTVHYTLTPAAMSYTGTQTLTFAGWTAYNVSSNESNTYKYYTFNMTYVAQGPELANYDFETGLSGGVEYNTLRLYYDVNVSIDANGSFNAYVYNDSGSLITITNISYTATVKDNVATLSLNSNDMTYNGRYRITLPLAFARDELYQPSKLVELNVTKRTSSSSELPGPLSITQSSTNASEVFVEFGNKLDPYSAAYKDNYSISEAVISAAELVMNTDYKATVKLTIVPGTLPQSKDYVLYISGVSGYNNSHGAIQGFQRSVYLKENVAPVLKSARLVDSTTIELEFDEGLDSTAGKVSFNVYQGNSSIGISSSYPSYISGTKVVLNLAVSLYNANELIVVPRGDCIIKDWNGNQTELSTNPITVTN